jgi:hypothetical protein
MLQKTSELVDEIKEHRLFSHPMFKHWAQSAPSPEVLGAMFHQIQCFCASTRPGLNFPEGLRSIGLQRASELIDGIVASESGHGPELATMAAHVINQIASQPVFTDLYDQVAIEAKLKEFSNGIMGGLPGYDHQTGLTTQARKAIQVFEKRSLSDPETTLTSLGASLALEIVSNQHLIPGEKTSLIDSGIYGVSLDEAEMHYLAEHWGECGAEQQHERYVIEAIDAVMTPDNESLIFAGAFGFLDSLAQLWDIIDASLLQSGYHEAPARLSAQA